MIAKPSNKTIPLGILLVIIIAILGWLFDSKQDETASNGSSASNSFSHLTSRPNRKSPRNKKTSSLPHAHINAQKRLKKISLEFPALAPPYKDPDYSLNKLYNQLFPDDNRDDIDNELQKFSEILDGKQPWNKDEARKFLTKHHELLTRLIQNSEPPYHFQAPPNENSFLLPISTVFRLLNVSFALQTKLGDTQAANATYRATNQLIEFAQGENLSSIKIPIFPVK